MMRPGGDRAANDVAVKQVCRRILGSILRTAGDLEGTIDPARRPSDVEIFRHRHALTLLNCLIGLILRRSRCSLLHRANDGTSRELDLEIVLSLPFCLRQHLIREFLEDRFFGLLAFQHGLGGGGAPRLVRHAAKRDPRLIYRVRLQR